MKRVKVSYDFISGEFSNNSEVVITVKNGKNNATERAIHEYFNDFYGKGNTDNGMTEKGRKYFYHGCHVCVKITSYELIKEDTWCSLCKRNKACPLYFNIKSHVGLVNSELNTPVVGKYFKGTTPIVIMYVDGCKKFVDMY